MQFQCLRSVWKLLFLFSKVDSDSGVFVSSLLSLSILASCFSFVISFIFCTCSPVITWCFPPVCCHWSAPVCLAHTGSCLIVWCLFWRLSFLYIYIFILFLFIVSFSVSLSVLFTAHCSVFLVNSCWDKNISQCSSTHNTPLLMQAISETVPVLCQCWLILSCALCPQYVFQILCSNQ